MHVVAMLCKRKTNFTVNYVVTKLGLYSLLMSIIAFLHEYVVKFLDQVILG